MRSLVLGALCIAAGCGTVLDDGMPPGGNPDGNNPGNGDGGPTPDVPGGVGEPAALVGITLAHNEARAAVDTQDPLPSLTWNPDLAATAAAWIAQCRDTEAPSGLIDHNPGRSDGHPYYVGENIYASGGQADPQQAVELWVSEASNYNYANNSCSGVCGHYTQVVWRASRELGCAVGTCAGLQFPNAIVCNYGPGGNNGGRPY
jgi:pathogenesis-related protein 1